MAGGSKLAFLTFERGGVGADVDTEGGGLKFNGRESLGLVAGGDGVTNASAGDTSESNDVAGDGFADFFATETLIGKEGFNFGLGDGLAVGGGVEDGNGFAFLELATEDFADGVFAEVVVGGESGDQQLGALLGSGVGFGGGDVVDDGFKDDVEVVVQVGGGAGAAVAGDGVVDGIIQLGFVGGEFQEEIGNFGFYLGNAGGGLVNFVDDDDRFQMQGEGFFQDELGLGHRAFLGVYDQEYAIGHIESALNFTRKIGVAGSVNDVDFVAVVENGGLLGGDGDAALVFLVHGVHNQSLGHLGLVGAESVGLLQETINEGGLAVVNVGDDGDVADFGSSSFHNLSIVALFGGFSKGLEVGGGGLGWDWRSSARRGGRGGLGDGGGNEG